MEETNRPTYKSKNDKALKKRLTGILNSKGYNGYDASRDSVYSDFTSGNLNRSKIAAQQTVDSANRNLGRNTYAQATAQAQRHSFDANNNAIVPKLSELDYEKQKSSRENQYAGMKVLQQNESTAYGRYRDKVKDWEFDRNADLKEAYIKKKQAEAAAAAAEKQAKADAKAAEKAAKEAAKAAKGKKGGSGGGSTSTVATTPTNTNSEWDFRNRPDFTYDYEARYKNSGNVFNKSGMNYRDSRFQNETKMSDQLYDRYYGQKNDEAATTRKTADENVKNNQDELKKVSSDIATTEKNIAAAEKSGDRAKENYNKALLEAQTRRKNRLDALISSDNKYIDDHKTISERKEDIKEKEDRIKQLDSLIEKQDNKLLEMNSRNESSGAGYYDKFNKAKSARDDFEGERLQLEYDLKEDKVKVEEQKYSRLTPDQMDQHIAKAKGEEKEILQQVKWNKQQDINNNIIKEDKTVKDILSTIPENGFGLSASWEFNQKEQQGAYGTKTYDAIKELDKAGYDGKSLVETYKRQRNEENYNTKIENAAAFAENHPALASGMSVGQNVVKGGAILNTLGRNAANAMGMEYKPVDYKDASYTIGAMSEAERGQVSSDIANSKAGEVGAFAYNVGMSMVDSLAQRYALGPASTYILGAGAASDAARSAAERGLDDKSVAKTAIAAGAAEYLFETIELESLKQFKQEAVTGYKTYWKNVAKQAINEGFGEGMTDITNAFTDWIVNKDESELNNKVRSYLDQGFSYADAKEMVKNEWLKEFSQDVLAGAISGGISAGGEMSIRSRMQGAMLNNTNSAQALIESGLESNQNTESYKQALAAQQKIDNGQKLSNVELSNLQNANMNAINEETANNIANKLENAENGSENAEIITNAVAEGNISTSEAKTIMQSPQALSVLSEVSGIDLNSNSTVSQVKAAAEQAQGATIEGTSVDNSGVKAIGAKIASKTGEGTLAGVEFKNGNPTIVMNAADGSKQTVNLRSYVSTGNNNIDTLVRNISNYGESGAKGYIQGYDGSLTADEYTKGYNAFYQAGMVLLGKENVNSVYGNMLPISVRETAYQNGLNDAGQTIVDKANKVVKTPVADYGLTKTENTNLSETEEKMLESFAKTAGVDIIMSDDNNVNGLYSKGKIYISNTADNPAMVVLLHEYTHHLEDTAPAAYAAYRNEVIKFLKNSEKYDEIADDIRALYNKNNVKLTEEGLMNEVAANATEAFLSDPEGWQQTLSENKTFLQKLVDFISDFVEYLKTEFGGNNISDEGAKLISENEAALRKLQKLYTEAMNEANDKMSEDGDARYSINNNFKTEYDMWDHKDVNVVFHLGKTTDLLNDILGIDESDIIMRSGKIISIQNDHKEMTDGVIKRIPEILEKPIIVLESKTVPGRAVVYGELLTPKGPVMAALELEPKDHGKKIDATILIASAYSRETRNNAQNLLNSSQVRYITEDKKRTKTWERLTQLQLPFASYRVGSGKNVAHDEVNVNATKPGERSEMQKAFDEADIPRRYSLKKDSAGNKLSKGQQEYFADTKIVDKEGNLRVMYHGSSEKFTEFDPKKAKRSGTFGSGLYFSGSESHAGQYGNTYEVYLNSVNPLSSVNPTNKITEKQMKAFIQELADNEDYGLENYGYGATVDSVYDSVKDKDDFAAMMDLNLTAVGNMAEAVKLFNEINGTNIDGIDTPMETVVFEPNQVKLTDNENPTESKDMRFSLKKPVEETKDLIAVHNLSEEKLMNTLELGGFAMPSIAIIKSDLGHSNFGKISVVFGKDTIDPKANKANKVYSGDAYTPTFPAVSYNVNEKFADKLYSKMIDLERKHSAIPFNSVSFHPDNLRDKLVNMGGVQAIIDSYKNNYGLKNAYLAETDNQLKEMPQKEVDNQIDPLHKKEYEEILKLNIPEDESAQREFVRENEAKLRDIIANTWSEEFGEEKARRMADNRKLLQLWGAVKNAKKYANEDNNGTKFEADIDEAHRIIDERIDQAEYEQWLEDNLRKIEGKKGIRNNKDLFTPSGNRRSWEALHDEVNLENIIKAMKKDGETGISFAGPSIYGAAQQDYKSIDEIRNAKGRLQMEDEELFHQKKMEFVRRFSDLEHALANSAMGATDAGNVMAEAVSKFSTKSAIANYIRKEGQGWTTYKEWIVDDLLDLVEDIRNMPTGYFEAKPQRAVGFDEIKAVIIPDNSSIELKEALEENNIPYETYEPGNEDQRIELLNNVEDAKFSLKKSADTGVQFDEQADVKNYMADLLQQAVDTTVKFNPTDKQLDTMAKMYISKLNSDYDIQTFKNTIKNMAETLNNNQAAVAKDAVKVLQSMSMRILESSKELDYSMKEQYKDVADYLKKTNIKLTDKQKQEAAYRYGSYNEFRKKYFGKIKLSKEGISPDVALGELSEKYPELFTADITEGDAPFILADVLDVINTPTSTKLADVVGYGSLEQQSFQMASDMISKLMTTMNPTEANAVKQVNQLRSQFNEQLEAEKKKIKEEFFDKMKNISADLNMDIADPDTMIKIAQNYANITQHSKEMTEKRREQATRSKYKKDARKIADSLYKALTSPTESRYIPQELVNGVIDFCKQINFDTGFRKPDGQPTKAYEKLMAMRKSYEHLRHEDADTGMVTLMARMGDGSLKDTGATYDATIPQLIDQVAEMFADDKKINDLSTGELEDLVKGLSYIDQSVRNATKLKGKYKSKESYVMADSIIDDIKKSGGSKNIPINAYTNAVLSPKRFFRRLIGYRDNSEMMKLYNDLQKGEIDQHRYQQESEDIFKPVMEGRANEKMLQKITGKKAEWIDIGLKDADGKPVMITPAMKMSLYMHSLNKSNAEHAAGGGIKIPDMKLYKAGKIQEAYNKGTIVKIPENFIKNVEKQLTNYEKSFVKCAKEYFDGYSKELVNKTSMQLLGYEKARVKNYFPIRTDSNFNRSAFDTIAFDFSIANSGFLKTRQQGSKNPIMLEDITAVVKRQIDAVSKYAALAVPIDNFNKVFNVTLMDYENSVKNQIAKTWDQSSMKYIANLMADLNGARQSDKSLVSDALAKARGLMAQGVLTGNLSVTMKQAASYPTAAATVGWGPLAKAFSKGVINSKAKVELINKYTPEYRYRGAGNSTVELGDLAAQNSLLTKAGKVPVLGAFLNSIQNADIWTTGKLWDAAEYYVADNFNYKKGSDSYYRKTAEIYNDIIHDTQPNYSILNRPEILRNKSEAAKALTMFMTQRLQNGNILMDSAMNLRAKAKAFKADNSASNLKSLKEARVEFANSVTSQIVAAMVIGGMTLLAKAAYHNMDRYRDKDNELTSKAFWNRFTSDVIASLAGSFLFGSELYDFVSSAITGEKYYGISDNLFGNLEDAADGLSKFVDVCKKEFIKEDTEEYDFDSVAAATSKFASTLCQAVGVPLSNFTNLEQGIRMHYQDIKNGEAGSFEAGLVRRNSENAQRLYDAFMSGDEAEVEKFYNAMVGAGKTEKQIETSLKKVLAEQNETVAAGAQAKHDMDIDAYVDAVNDLVRLGFERDTVLNAINQYIEKNFEEKEEKEDNTKESYTYDEIMEQTSTGRLYDKDMMYQAVDNHDLNLAENIKQDAIDSEMKKNDLSYDDAEKKVMNSIKNGVKAEYSEKLYSLYSTGKKAEADKLKNSLMDIYGYKADGFKEWIPEGTKEKLVSDFMAGKYTDTKAAKVILNNYGFDEDDYTGWVVKEIKNQYIDAYNKNDTAKTKMLQEKAESLGRSYSTVLEWVGKKVSSDTTDNIESAIKTFSGGSGDYNTYINKMVAARDAEIARIMEETGKDEWDARSSYKSTLTNYFKKIYKDMSVEDRNRLQNILNNYCWFGKSRKKNTPYKYSKWLEADTSKEDDEETVKLNW